MIQLLANKYQKTIAFAFFIVFYCSTVFLSYGSYHYSNYRSKSAVYSTHYFKQKLSALDNYHPVVAVAEKGVVSPEIVHHSTNLKRLLIGGPSQPEMTSFKPIGADNMVNLFSGDFSYNIPLMDVGGYPINIYYDASITPDQDASWVGLGWNINPGNINRNMRGVPDDFNGEDSMVQMQNMKPNKTWGAKVGGDLEVVGIKNLLNFNLGANLGMSFNNYLGPAIEVGVKGSAALKLSKKVILEKSAGTVTDSGLLSLNIGAGINANLSSRGGLTVSPSVSLGASMFNKNVTSSFGISASTSYNSRYGVRELQISEQMSFHKEVEKKANSKSDDAKKAKPAPEPNTTKPRNCIVNIDEQVHSSVMSFSRPSYTPALRMPITNEAYSGHFQFGLALYGIHGSLEAEGYSQKAYISSEHIIQNKKLVGYIYAEKAMNNPDMVMDFTRFNDKEVSPKTPIISVPQYTFDVFSIQGEGTGGSIRAYRNELGYVRDIKTESKDKSFGLGADVSLPGHFGANVNIVHTPTSIGNWEAGNNIAQVLQFQPSKGISENVYFRNPGECSVINDTQFLKYGGIDLVRFNLGRNPINPTVEPILTSFTKDITPKSTIDLRNVITTDTRKKRTQVIDFLTALEASRIGLDKIIKSFDCQTILDGNNQLKYDAFNRVSNYRKSHHISQINVTEANGKRYVYGVPVYNIRQKDFTFTVAGTSINNSNDDLTSFTSDETSPFDNRSINSHSGGKDGYVQTVETPAYAHSFLLSGLLSNNYVDVTGDGITDDDLGDAVKFNYTRIKNGNDWAVQKWRTPMTASAFTANFNAGNRSEGKDDKGIISYGERESWYTHSIESKTMIALFRIGNRNDGKGTSNEFGGINASDNTVKKLERIDLYSKADLKAYGFAKAKPIKTVHFSYSYTLCSGMPNSTNGVGKLTLDSIYFTFNGQNRGKKNKYVFSYINSANNNPNYAINSSDRWGNYKAKTQNPQSLKNGVYPYSIQDKTIADANASVWSLKKILLPSGGQIEVQYESDDYAYVQNKRATNMMQIVGLGSNSNYSEKGNDLYDYNILALKKAPLKNYLFIRVPNSCNNNREVFTKYIEGNTQLAVKLAVYVPKGKEYLTVYPTISINMTDSNSSDPKYGITSDPTVIWIKMNEVDGYSPLALTALEYLREQLPGQAFAGYDVSENGSLEKIVNMLFGWLDGLKNAFKNPLKALMSDSKARFIELPESFVRLNCPNGVKYGGGQRVKSVVLKDNWKAMTKQYTSVYGQQYDYTTDENFDGKPRRISSGVATYEPSIGGEENPFVQMVQVGNQLPLGPASYSATETPVLDAFFPAPSVGYSKVTVRSIRNVPTNFKSRSGIGKQETEYYTAKDYPVLALNTQLDHQSDKKYHNNETGNFFYKYAYDSRAISQGFLVALNDMHGKMKSQTSFAENDSILKINYTKNYYRNTGEKGTEEQFGFITPNRDKIKSIIRGNMGIDVELMTDTREFLVSSNSVEVQAQLDYFPVWPGLVWLPFIWPVTMNVENNYRAVTTTKVVNYHAVLDSIVVMDKGSQVSTKNMFFDAETGQVVVSKTNNEFETPIYHVSYPAYWAYPQMGLAYKNIGLHYENVPIRNGVIDDNSFNQSLFSSGDEIYIDTLATPEILDEFACIRMRGQTSNFNLPVNYTHKIWALDINKDEKNIKNGLNQIVFIDKDGQPYNGMVANMRVVRSGNRNLLEETVCSLTSLDSLPFFAVEGSGWNANYSNNILNAQANEFKEKWRVEDAFASTNNCTSVFDVNKAFMNPYSQGILGNWRAHKSYAYLGDRDQKDPLTKTNIRKDGAIVGFTPLWLFTNKGLVKSLNNLSQTWVWTSQISRVNRKGQEIENYDALMRYNAGQYGYGGNLPTAIANNARYREMGYDGFEDYSYGSSLAPTSCMAQIDQESRHMRMGVTVSDISTTESHTGNSSLQLAPGKNKLFAAEIGEADLKMIDEENNPDLTIKFTKDAYNHLMVTPRGHGLTRHGGDPSLLHNDSNLNHDGGGGHFSIIWTGYLQIEHEGNYTLYCPGIDDHAWITIFKSPNKGQTAEFQYGNGGPINGRSTNIFNLQKGTYNIEVKYEEYGGDDAHFHLRWQYNIYDYPYTFTSKDQGQESIPAKNLYDEDSLPPASTEVTTRFYCMHLDKVQAPTRGRINQFSLVANSKMLLSAWVKESVASGNYTQNSIHIINKNANSNSVADSTVLHPTGAIIDGWQRYEAVFDVPKVTDTDSLYFRLCNNSTNSTNVYFDDIRIHPYHSNMKSYVFDPISLRLVAELDANNYASFYEYDEEGTLIRTKAETREGIKTIKETRSAQQKAIREVVQ